MDVPAFDARKIVRSALRTIALYFSIIAVSLMTMARPAGAAVDAVPPISGGNTYYCYTYYGLQASNLADFQAVINAQWPPGGWYTLGAQGVADSGQCGNYNADGSQHAQYNAAWYSAPAVCPTPAIGAVYTFNPQTGMCERPAQDICPVSDLPALPADDLCAQSLDMGSGVDVNNACPGLTPEMQSQAQCLADKIRKLTPAIPYTKPSATIRNTAYQNHLLAVWNKSKEIVNLKTDADKQTCATLIADVNNEMALHGITTRPSSLGNQAPHVLGRAIDIPKNIAKALKAQTVWITGDVQDYVNSATMNPPACNLRWGGRFMPVDTVHFQLP